MQITTDIAELLGSGIFFIIDYKQIKKSNLNWRFIFTFKFKP